MLSSNPNYAAGYDFTLIGFEYQFIFTLSEADGSQNPILPAWLKIEKISSIIYMLYGKPPSTYSAGDTITIKISTIVTKSNIIYTSANTPITI